MFYRFLIWTGSEYEPYNFEQKIHVKYFKLYLRCVQRKLQIVLIVKYGMH